MQQQQQQQQHYDSSGRQERFGGPLTKFPRTEHLFDAGGSGVTRDDLVLAPADAAARFYAPGVVVAVQEKVDGANLGVSFDPSPSFCQGQGGGGQAPSQLRFQNRSHFVCGAASGVCALRSFESPGVERTRSLPTP